MDDLALKVAARFEGDSDDVLSLRVAARFERVAFGEGKFLGRDCRLTWTRHGWRLEELPTKGKKKCKVATLQNPASHNNIGLDAYIDANILSDANLSPSDGYDAIKQKMLDAYQKAADAALQGFARNRPQDAKHYEWLRDLKWYEEEVHYLKIVPEDTAPIVIEGKDFKITSEWTKFKVYDPNADMASHDPHYTMYEAKSAGAARKLYQMAKANQNLLKSVSWSELSDWFRKNQIAYDSHSSQWH